MYPVAQQLEALKLLKDWSIWMVTVETASIAFLGTVAEKLIDSSTIFFPITIAMFSTSIVMAAWVLGGIPSVAQRVDGSKNFLHYRIYNLGWLPERVTLSAVAVVQHTLFVLGILCLATLIIWYRI